MRVNSNRTFDGAISMKKMIQMIVMGCMMITLMVSADTGKPPVDVPDLHAKGFDFWVYNDIEKAREIARKTNKPMFVTFRCIPCVNCKGFDAEVASGKDGLEELAEQFVPVRQIEMKNVDLSQFQFDYDLNWAAMFINADGTVYARYGTQSAEGADAYNSMESLKNTMRRVLELHKNYPNNKAELAEKKGEPKPYKTALQMPGLEHSDKRAQTTKRNNCVHCHNIHDAEYATAYQNGTFKLEMMYRYPLPKNIGLEIDRDHGLKVSGTVSGSGATGKLQVGDVLTHADGQRLTSIADLQWVLHHKPNTRARVQLKALRGDKPVTLTLTTEAGWKKTDFTWRGSMWNMRPRPGFWSPPVEPDKVKGLNLPAGAEPMLVKWINTGSAEGRNAYQSGLRENDIVTHVDGKLWKGTPKDFHIHLRMNKKVGETLRLRVLRNHRPRDIEIKLIDGF